MLISSYISCAQELVASYFLFMVSRFSRFPTKPSTSLIDEKSLSSSFSLQGLLSLSLSFLPSFLLANSLSSLWDVILPSNEQDLHFGVLGDSEKKKEKRKKEKKKKKCYST